ncbi:MAG: DUF4864 domain-containing protein [Burkholderiaceae bacterium]
MHRPHVSRRRALIALAAAALAGPSLAAHHVQRKVSAVQARQARQVVQAQLDAFAADDSSRAFGYATPAIRKAFDDQAERFMSMVKCAYPQVVRPRSITFLKAAWVDGTLTQAVQLVDDTGSVWLALYQLQQQADKAWRIAGCEIFAAEGRMI